MVDCSASSENDDDAPVLENAVTVVGVSEGGYAAVSATVALALRPSGDPITNLNMAVLRIGRVMVRNTAKSFAMEHALGAQARTRQGAAEQTIGAMLTRATIPSRPKEDDDMVSILYLGQSIKIPAADVSGLSASLRPSSAASYGISRNIVLRCRRSTQCSVACA